MLIMSAPASNASVIGLRKKLDVTSSHMIKVTRTLVLSPGAREVFKRLEECSSCSTCSERVAGRTALPEARPAGLVLSLLLLDAGGAALLEASRDAAGRFVDAGCADFLSFNFRSANQAEECELSMQM